MRKDGYGVEDGSKDLFFLLLAQLAGSNDFRPSVRPFKMLVFVVWWAAGSGLEFLNGEQD